MTLEIYGQLDSGDIGKRSTSWMTDFNGFGKNSGNNRKERQI